MIDLCVLHPPRAPARPLHLSLLRPLPSAGGLCSYRQSAWGWRRRKKARELGAPAMQYLAVHTGERLTARGLVAVACYELSHEATADGDRDRPVLYWCAHARPWAVTRGRG